MERRSLPSKVNAVSWRGGRAKVRMFDGPLLAAGIQKVARQVKPHLVHAGPIQRSAFLAALAGLRPLVTMSWGYDLIRDARRNRLWQWATRYTLSKSAMMVGDCAAIKELAEGFGMEQDRIVLFPWGIDLDHFSVPPQKNRAREFTVLSTRNFEPVYGVDTVVKAFVDAAGQISNLRLTLVGCGSMEDQLRCLVEKAGLNRRVSFCGTVSQARLPEYYRGADLYVSATHSDGTSISLLEAMATGCPSAVSAVGGNPEWISPGQQGWLFPCGDVDALSRIIVEAVGQPDRLREMGSSARRIVEKRGNWSLNFQRLLNVYDRALALSSKEGPR